MPPVAYTQIGYTTESRAKKLQLLGILSGFAAGAWLGAAEAPTKLVSIGVSPMVISLIMVIGVFLARWSLPALILGTSSVRADVRRCPHLIVWAILAGCLWAVANTLTIFAIRDIGLSIAFPLWNSNSLLGILWGFLFFNELRQAGWRRWTGVLGGTVVMCVGATLLADARRLYLGDWRRLPAIRRKICGHQPRHPAFQFQPALGITVGRIRLRRAARPRHLDLHAGSGRLAADDVGSRRDCFLVGQR